MQGVTMKKPLKSTGTKSKRFSDKILHQVVDNVMENAMTKIEKISERALLNVDSQSREILIDYLAGEPLEQLARKKGLEIREIKMLINQSKTLWIEELRRQVSVKQ